MPRVLPGKAATFVKGQGLAVRGWCVWHNGDGERNEMNIDWSKWALLTVLALYVGIWIGVWWWAIELMVGQGNS